MEAYRQITHCKYAPSLDFYVNLLALQKLDMMLKYKLSFIFYFLKEKFIFLEKHYFPLGVEAHKNENIL